MPPSPSSSTSALATSSSSSSSPTTAAPAAPPGFTSATAYFTEQVGCPPIQIVNDVVNAANATLENLLTGFAVFLKDQSGESVEYKQGLHEIETLAEHALDTNFDKFELYCLKNLFTLPESAASHLSHYKGVDLTFTKDDESVLDSDIAKEEQLLLEHKKRNIQLKQNLDATNQKLRVHECCCRQLKQITEATEKGRDESLTQALLALTDQLQDLTETVATSQELSDHPLLKAPRKAKPDVRSLYLKGLTEKRFRQEPTVLDSASTVSTATATATSSSARRRRKRFQEGGFDTDDLGLTAISRRWSGSMEADEDGADGGDPLAYLQPLSKKRRVV